MEKPMTDNYREPLTPREQELSDRAGSRLLLIWLMSLAIIAELAVIVHLAK
jgi:hypothetical protein